MKLTPWFPGHIKPSRPGVYQVKLGKKLGYRRFEFGRWYAWRFTIKGAAQELFMSAMVQVSWRGLAEDPSESVPGGFFQSREALDMGQGKP